MWFAKMKSVVQEMEIHPQGPCAFGTSKIVLAVNTSAIFQQLREQFLCACKQYSQRAFGHDLRFTDPDGKALNYEIEAWKTNSPSYVWVQVPELEATGVDSIRAYWGNPAAVTSPPVYTTNGAVWSEAYDFAHRPATGYDDPNQQRIPCN